MKRFLLLALWAICSVIGHAQITVKGTVVNERGDAVEYVTIGFEGDSIGTIADRNGHFTLQVPENRKGGLIFTHVSYATSVIPHETYSAGKELQIVLKDKVIELTEITIGKANKPTTLSGKRLGAMELMISGKGAVNGCEFGPTFKCHKNATISDILLTITGCTYEWCVVSFNVYEVRKGKFINILNKPMYYRIEKNQTQRTLDFQPEETILLRKGQSYYVSVAVVDAEGKGGLSMKSQLKSSCVRHIGMGEKRKLPIGPAITVKGFVVD